MLRTLALLWMGLNALALFRGVTQRDEAKRQTPWREVIGWFYDTLIAASESDLAGLRPRSHTPVA